MVVTRRGLAAAGAGALLAAGCGASEDLPVASDAELLGAVLAVERVLAKVLTGVLAARAREHVRRLGRAGARPTGPPPAGDPLELQRRSMRACVEAVGGLRSSAARTLAADVLADGAQHIAILLGRTIAFPDGRTP